jgi:hypothetical protein
MKPDSLKNDLYEPLEITTWGFNAYSEKINGRVAMLGFFLVFLIEVLSKEKLISWIQ